MRILKYITVAVMVFTFTVSVDIAYAESGTVSTLDQFKSTTTPNGVPAIAPRTPEKAIYAPFSSTTVGVINVASTTATSTMQDVSVDDLKVRGNIEIIGAALFTTVSSGNFTVNGNLVVTGTSDLRGAVSNSTGNLTISDAVNISGIITSTASTANVFPYASTTALTVSGTGGFYVGTLSGLLKGTSGAVTAATAGTDYIAGGVGANTQLAYFTGSGVLTSDADVTFTNGNLLTATYASTTMLASSQGATFATASGNVGIGDTSPDATLETLASFFVSEVADGNGDILSVSNTATIFNDDSSDRDFTIESDQNANMFTLDGQLSGRIAFGTTVSDSVYYKIGGSWTPSFTGGTQTGLDVVPSITGAANGNVNTANIGGTLVEAGSGNHEFLTALTLTVPTITAGAGTVNSATTLLITGAPSATASVGNFALYSTSGLNYFGGNVGIGTTSPAAKLGMTGSFGVSPTHMFLETTGNVGIGTGAPIFPLHVEAPVGQALIKSSTGTNVAQLRFNNTAGTGLVVLNGATATNQITNGGLAYAMDFIAPGATSAIQLATNDTARMTILGTGEVGIGTNAPEGALHIKGVGALGVLYVERTSLDAIGLATIAELRSDAKTVNDAVSLRFQMKDSGSAAQNYSTIASTIIDPTAGSEDGRLDFYTTKAGATTLQMSINELGNVGIGTTSPWRTLSVSGTMGLSSSLSSESGTDNALCIDPVTYEVTNGGTACGSAAPMTAKGVTITETTVTNTTASTTIFTSASWSDRTYSANSLAAANQICFDVRGAYSLDALGGSAIIRLVSGTGSATTTIAQVTTSSLFGGASSAPFNGDGCVTIRTIGASGTMRGDGTLMYQTSGLGTTATDFAGGTGTVDTTVAQTFDITVTWGAADTDNIITIRQASVTLK